MTTHDSCIGHGDARNHSHSRQGIVVYDAVFVGLAYILASKVDGHVSRLPSNLAASTTETPSSLYVVGSAAGIISVGYLLWILRGSTAITFLASSAPRWRMVEPTAILTAYRGSIEYDEDQMKEMPQCAS